jgi:hypothetical protein
VISYGYLPFSLYKENENLKVQLYILGVYLVFTAGSYLFGCLISGLCIRFKKEKWLIIFCLFLGVLALVPMILNIYYYTLTTESIISTSLSSLFSMQCGMLETFIIKIIAVNTRKPKFQLLLLKGITSATSAAFFFTGL